MNKNRPNILWTGGATYFFSPFLYKSNNFSESWKFISLANITWDDAYLSIALHSADSNIAYVGMLMGVVLKTDDGGNTWLPILVPSERRAFVGLALSRD